MCVRPGMSVFVMVCETRPLPVYPIVFRHPGLPVGGKHSVFHFIHRHVRSFLLVSLIWHPACASSLRRRGWWKKPSPIFWIWTAIPSSILHTAPLNLDNVNCKHCYDVLKIKKRAPWNHLKRRIQQSPWQYMKRHIKYNDPVLNYSALSSFYQMIIITSIHFTILPLAFYLDWKPFSFGWGSWRFEWHLHILSCRWLYATAIDAFCSSYC